MPDRELRILLDQNIPFAVTSWLRCQRPFWKIWHVNDLGFGGKPDDFLYRWAQRENALIITFDEDFADSRLYPLGKHYGVIRLRIWPTTVERTIDALMRLLEGVSSEEWIGSLIIIDNNKIRIRRGAVKLLGKSDV